MIKQAPITTYKKSVTSIPPLLLFSPKAVNIPPGFEKRTNTIQKT